MVAKDEDGKSIPIPGLILENEQGVRRFARSKKRKEEAFIRDTQFESSHFNMKEHIEGLKDENVKLSLH